MCVAAASAAAQAAVARLAGASVTAHHALLPHRREIESKVGERNSEKRREKGTNAFCPLRE
jgi:hypothetical protein